MRGAIRAPKPDFGTFGRAPNVAKIRLLSSSRPTAYEQHSRGTPSAAATDAPRDDDARSLGGGGGRPSFVFLVAEISTYLDNWQYG